MQVRVETRLLIQKHRELANAASIYPNLTESQMHQTTLPMHFHKQTKANIRGLHFGTWNEVENS